VDRLDVCTERVALVLGPDSVLAIARYVGEPAAAWTGDHPANFYRTSGGTNQARARIGVAGDRERLVEVQVGVDRGLDVVKDDVADGERTGAGQNRLWRDQSGRKGRLGRDRLEGRTGRVEPLGRAVEKRHHRIAQVEQAGEIARVKQALGAAQPRAGSR